MFMAGQVSRDSSATHHDRCTEAPCVVGPRRRRLLTARAGGGASCPEGHTLAGEPPAPLGRGRRRHGAQHPGPRLFWGHRVAWKVTEVPAELLGPRRPPLHQGQGRRLPPDEVGFCHPSSICCATKILRLARHRKLHSLPPQCCPPALTMPVHGDLWWMAASDPTAPTRGVAPRQRSVQLQMLRRPVPFPRGLQAPGGTSCSPAHPEDSPGMLTTSSPRSQLVRIGGANYDRVDAACALSSVGRRTWPGINCTSDPVAQWWRRSATNASTTSCALSPRASTVFPDLFDSSADGTCSARASPAVPQTAG